MNKDFYYYCDKFSGLHITDGPQTELADGESPYMKNFTVCDGYKLKKREGSKLVFEGAGAFRGLWSGTLGEKEYLIAVFGNTFYLDGKASGDLEGEGECSFVPFENKLYILTGKKIKVFDGESVGDITPYRPLVAISTPPDGGGTPFEEANLLTGMLRQSFSPDGEKKTFKLAVENIDSVDYVKISGNPTDSFTYDAQRGTVSISTDLPTFPDSVEIGFTKGSADSRIEGCRFGVPFGGGNDTRVFLWGNEDCPATRFFSEPTDGMASFEYFPENNFTVIGAGEKITSILRQYDRQIIFTPNSAYISYADGDRFPVYALSSVKGCKSPRFACLINNRPVSICTDGIYGWSSTALRDERNAVKLSQRIDAALAEIDKSLIRSFDREATGEFYIYYSDKIYVYNYLLDVFYYYEGITAKAFAAVGDKLYFANDSGLFTMEGTDDNGKEISSVWHSHYNGFSGKGRNKTVFAAEVSVMPALSTSMRLSYAADNANGKECKLYLSAGSIDFASFDFSAFGFHTTAAAHHFRRRLHVKGCKNFKLIISNDEPAGTLYITSIALSGRITDKK